jgi:hypothetical protein
MSSKTQPKPTTRFATAIIPELEQSKTAVLNTLASLHSRRSCAYAIERFMWALLSLPRGIRYPNQQATARVQAVPSLGAETAMTAICRAMIPEQSCPPSGHDQGEDI